MSRRRYSVARKNLFLAFGSLVLFGSGVVLLFAASITIPDIESLKERKVTQSTKIYDRTGEVLLDDLGDDVTRTIVPISDIALNIQQATIAIEDKEFYEHQGIKVSSLIRSVLINVVNLGYVQGGSTITQQVVKNSILTTDKTIIRKAKEWVLAVKLDQMLTKEQILEIYLNESPYGGSVYGVEEASMRFYGKRANAVTLAEAAYLAAIPQAPTYYSPYGNNREALESRKNLVLTLMHEQGYISEEEMTNAQATKVAFLPPATQGIRAPHFVFYVREQLEREYGREALEKNGWRIITTLDATLQASGEEIVKRYALANEKAFNASNAALVAIDPDTGDVLTMVGSRDYFDTNIDGNVNVAVAERQPGSSFKPFVYAAAFERGYAPETVTFDSPVQFSTSCPIDSTSDTPPCYFPGNYDLKFRGPMSFRDALAQSINIVALKALYLVGIQDAITVARALGITTLEDPSRYGLTLVLGGGEVKLLELVSAYSVFANEGLRNPYRTILTIEERDGTVFREYPLSPSQVLPVNVANNISDVLSDNEARSPEFGLNSALYVPGHHVAAKTGTTNDFRDTWIVGYTTSLAVGAWAGNNDNSPMEKKVAGFIVAPLWNEFIRTALVAYPEAPFPEPESLVSSATKPIVRGVWQGTDPVVVDAVTGAPVPEGYMGQTKLKVTTNIHDILYWVDTDNPNGAKPENPANDPQFARWEYSAQTWARANGYQDGVPIYAPLPR
jgi:penicillin-binding protein 1C